jgi:pimeloyl-ACP methyl ester carboxylesterase
MRLQAAEEPAVYEQWIAAMRESMRFVAPELRERLIACHHQVGPRSQHHDLVVIDQFDVQDRINTLTAPLLLIRGADDPLAPEEYEREIHEAVPGSQYLTLREAGHFPMAEQPTAVNRAIVAFLDTLGVSRTSPQRPTV